MKTKQWFDHISYQVETCDYCKSKIPWGESYFIYTIDLDKPVELKKACLLCVSKADYNKLKV